LDEVSVGRSNAAKNKGLEVAHKRSESLAVAVSLPVRSWSIYSIYTRETDGALEVIYFASPAWPCSQFVECMLLIFSSSV